MPLSRRQFLATSSLPAVLPSEPSETPVDFRYAPPAGQTAICFPDDSYKSLVGERGDLRYRHGRGLSGFGVAVEFSPGGVEKEGRFTQRIEAPEVPIVHTLIERAGFTLELTAFATNRQGEGRVDNVIAEQLLRGKLGRRDRLIYEKGGTLRVEKASKL